MAYSTYDRWGRHERNPPVERLYEILHQLDIETEDREHTDVSLRHHETGWFLSAFLSGRLMWAWDADADDDVPDPVVYGGDRHMKGVSRQKVLELWLKLAAGDIAAVEAELWVPGSH
jgi:hypothetical protein